MSDEDEKRATWCWNTPIGRVRVTLEEPVYREVAERSVRCLASAFERGRAEVVELPSEVH